MIFSAKVTSSAAAAVALLATVGNAAPASPISGLSKRDLPFAFGQEKVRGVNLGGWLVLEPWITPTMFDDTGNSAIVDEWTFCQLQSRATAQAALQNHWSTFYTEADFASIAAAGCVAKLPDA